MTQLTYLEAAVVGLVQGVTELLPISSLWHNVVLPAIVGGSWAADLNVAKPESPYLAFIVGLHVATAIALLIYLSAFLIGSAQILALLASISRDGVATVAGMFRGLSREGAARFAFLLATPVILAAGLLKVPDLMGPLGNGIRGQVMVGSVLSGIGAYVSARRGNRRPANAPATP
jgi:undecaprenyl pyrophosphate phosphatase UppP